MPRASALGPLLAALAVTLGCVALSPVAAGTGWAAGLRSSAPALGTVTTATTVQSVPGVDLQAVACPTVTTCVAVGITSKAALVVPQGNVDGAVVVTITNGVPGPVEQLSEASELYGIACPTATLCEAVGTRSIGSYIGGPAGLLATITPGAVPQVQSLTSPDSGGLLSVACASATRCEAVNTSQLVTIDNGVPSPLQPLDFPVTSVACANATSCEAVGSATTYSSTADPTGQIGVVPITSPSASTCQAVGSYYYGVTSPTIGPGPRGVVVPIVNGVPEPQDAQLTPGIKELLGVACPSPPSPPSDPSPTSCRAVGYQDRGVPSPQALMAPITNGVPDAVEPVSGITAPGTSAPSTVKLLAVACPSVTVCEAVGYTANTYAAPVGFTVAITAGTPTPVAPTTASLTYPFNGQTSVDTDNAFEWTPVPAAQAYRFTAGTAPGATNLSDSGVLPSSAYSYLEPVMPPGPTLYASVFTELDGVWRSQSVTFTVAPSQASFTAPLNNVFLNTVNMVDPTAAFTWSTIPQAQGYILVVGTTTFGTNVVNSGVLPASQLSYSPPILPTNAILHATLLTKVNGDFTRFQAITFITGPVGATFLSPNDGAVGVIGQYFVWTTRAQAQNYILVVGTTPLGTNVCNSGVLGISTEFVVPTTLPRGKTLYATLLTKVQGNWYYQTSTFKT